MGNVCRATKSRQVIDPVSFEDRYTLVDRLGEGGFGEVYTCVELKSGSTFAAKLVDNSRVTEWSTTDEERVPMEVKALASCDHPNIIQLLDYFVYQKHSIMVMEKPSASVDLFNYTAYLGGVSETETRQIMQQILEAVWYLHYDARIVHRDIKPENVLVDVRTKSCKLIDFGAATWFHPNVYTEFSGTRLYSPPELLLSGRYKAESLTTWSLGATLYFTLFSRLPFPDEQAIVDCIVRLPSNNALSPDCLQFLKSCLHPKPARRPSADGLLKHPWLANIGFFLQ
jgi:serine/threonine protein kinase